MTSMAEREVKLGDKYELTSGEVHLTGLQALVRLPLEQHTLDTAAGLNTATLVSGYEGSPLAGYDLELIKQNKLLDAQHVVVRPGVNEELAANAVQGSQLASGMHTRTYDGVVGIWYGKAPGLDRASDALRHANLGGAAPNGGALVLVGDDSIAKSSTVPSSSETAISELGMPVLVPSDPEDIMFLGLHGVALSRFSGLWVGMKLATNVVDGSGTTRVGFNSLDIQIPNADIDGTAYRHEVSANFLQPNLARLEASLTGARLELARRYIVENRLCTAAGDANARVGIITAGASHRDTMQALRRLGIDITAPGSGVRVLKLGAIHPLDHQTIIEFARGLDEVIVIEEKRAFVELAVKDILFSQESKPAVHGKRGPTGAPLMRADSDLPPEYIAERLVSRFEEHPSISVDRSRVASAAPKRRQLLPLLNRTPYFCSGCPHNRSTQVPDGSIVGAGIGCHAIAAMMPSERVGDIVALAQMGGEGAPWIGMAPFVSDKHLIQNLGDGTFHHSGSLAIRASVAAGSNITYKLLYNDAVAMTGGQRAVGKMSVPNIARELLAEGVARVVITTDDVGKYKKVSLPRSVKVHDRGRLLAIQEELAAVEGVTVLIHDQECATELRRKRKRKLTAEPAQRAFINERVCEGCGDCGQKSNCMSVQPVETPFGRKTRIDQASCNKDYSCLDGDCPSFVTVVPGKARRRPAASASVIGSGPPLPPPPVVTDLDDFGLRITGVGGTGVVTTAQILSTAASLAGASVQALDQLGLAQKGGAVVSDIKISKTPAAGANKVAVGDCDLYLGCDVLVAADTKNLAIASPDRTIAIVSTSQVPTGSMILEPGTPFPSTAETTKRILEHARPEHSAFADVRAVSRMQYGSDQYANIMLVGMAVQAGALPIAPSFIERAISLNGVSVEVNVAAFQHGRRLIAEPDLLAPSASSDRASHANDARDLLDALAPAASEHLRELVADYASELIDFQSRALAREFVTAVESFRALEASRLGSDDITSVFASSLFKLTAYKDEYEVARLYLDPQFEDELRRQFGDDARYRYQLHPPVLRALGIQRKISLGAWFKPVFHVLRSMRRLRGTWLDPFGYAKVRRVERELVLEFRDAATRAVARLTPANSTLVAELSALPDLVRGYESIKLNNVAAYRARLEELLKQLDA